MRYFARGISRDKEPSQVFIAETIIGHKGGSDAVSINPGNDLRENPV